MRAKRVAAGRRAAHVCGSAIHAANEDPGLCRRVRLDQQHFRMLSERGPRGISGGGLYLISPGSSSAIAGGLSTGLSPNLCGADGLLPKSS